MKFLNGWKTIAGVIGSVATLLISGDGKVAQIGATAVEVIGHLDSVALGVFGALTTLGIVHKAEKAASKKSSQ